MTTARIDFEASDEIRGILAGIGRTEDVKLSPDNSRLAIVDYVSNQIFLFALRISGLDTDLPRPAVAITDYSILNSDSLHQPHGLVFLDNNTIVVCNRTGDVCLYDVPAPGDAPRERDIEPLKRIRGTGLLFAKVKTPGSLDYYALGDNRYRVLVCNNHWHFISSHIIETGASPRVKNTGTLIQKHLRIPDGVCVSADTAWIAISNHVDGEILIYANTPQLNRDSAAVAALKGIVCPHGVRFTPDGRVLVADAASQYLHVFDNDKGDWSGEYVPSKSIRIMDDEVFYNGRYDSREGGLKGIDVDRSGRLLVTTHRFGVLDFHDLRELLAAPGAVDSAQMLELCRQRDQSLERYKSGMLARQWNLGSRLRQTWIDLEKDLKQRKQQARMKVRLARLKLRNRRCHESLLEASGPVLSMTSHPERVELVFYALESIGKGNRKPSRIMLWLTDEAAYRNPPATLRRLQARGLEIGYSEELGPHTKYYPYIEQESEFSVPLVTADDDTLYPREWLEQLLDAFATDTSAIHCFRAHRMRFSDGRLLPYNTWFPCEGKQPSHLNFITGVSGVIYPPAFLTFLKQQGNSFTESCPSADDIWLSANALRGGFKIGQVHYHPSLFPTIPGSQKRRLYDINVMSGQNQLQLRQTYSEADMLALQDLEHVSAAV